MGGGIHAAAAIVLAAALLMAGCTSREDEVAAAATEPAKDEHLGENLVIDCLDCAEIASPPPAAPVAPFDLLAEGPLAVASFEYDDPASLSQGGTLAPAYPARLKGIAFYPEDADELSPVLVFLHGMHGTCDAVGIGASDACVEPVGERIPNHRGYDYLGEHLASWGFVVVSIDGAQANDRDVAGPLTTTRGYQGTGPALRGDLVLMTLERLAAANATSLAGFEPLEGRLDLARIGIMGHSRGGEGVAATIAQNQAREEPFALRAVFALAPTDFARHDVRGVPFATLLPGCDGDVVTLEGALMYDDARFENEAPMHSLYVRGANHNFYNTVWTGDDSGYEGDPECSEGSGLRLTAQEQQATGVALIGGFFRAYLQEERGFLPYLRGDLPVDGAVCGRFASPCPRLAHASYQPPASERVLLDAADGDGSSNERGANSFDGFSSAGVCSDEPGTFPFRAVEPAEHPSCLGDNIHSAAQHNLSWEGAASWRLELGSLDASRERVLSFRIGIPPVDDAVSPALDITVADAAGRARTITLAPETPALFVTGSTEHAQTSLSTIRVPLDLFDVDRAQLASIALGFRTPGAGRAVVTDVALER